MTQEHIKEIRKYIINRRNERDYQDEFPVWMLANEMMELLDLAERGLLMQKRIEKWILDHDENLRDSIVYPRRSGKTIRGIFSYVANNLRDAMNGKEDAE